VSLCQIYQDKNRITEPQRSKWASTFLYLAQEQGTNNMHLADLSQQSWKNNILGRNETKEAWRKTNSGIEEE
jgi:hypothetical protein